MDSQEIDLAREDLAVLHAIASANNPVTTSTLCEQLHWANSSRQVRYRLDKLEERGLIKTRKDDDRSPAHQMPVRVATMTEAGREINEEFDDNPETLPVEKRLARLEKQVGKMQETYGKVKNRIVDLEEEVEEHDDDLKDVSEQIRNIKRVLADDTDSRNNAGSSDE